MRTPPIQYLLPSLTILVGACGNGEHRVVVTACGENGPHAGTVSTSDGGIGTASSYAPSDDCDPRDAAADQVAVDDAPLAAPLSVSVSPGSTIGTAVVSFVPAPSAADLAIHYVVTAEPGSLSATGSESPISISGLSAQTAYTFSIAAVGTTTGSSTPVSTGPLGFFDVLETFREPETQPNDTLFTGSFTFDFATHDVSNLSGLLTESMTLVNGDYGGPMTTVPLLHQLSSVPVTLGGAEGLLVTTFALPTVDTFDGGGFAPGRTQYYGLRDRQPNQHNAYAMIFVNLGDPTLPLVKEQVDKLAYADCTVGGMMGTACMTGTTKDGYGSVGSMKGYPVSQLISRR